MHLNLDTGMEYLFHFQGYPAVKCLFQHRHEKLKKQIGDFDIYITGYNKDEDLFTVVATSDKTRDIFIINSSNSNYW